MKKKCLKSTPSPFILCPNDELTCRKKKKIGQFSDINNRNRFIKAMAFVVKRNDLIDNFNRIISTIKLINNFNIKNA